MSERTGGASTPSAGVPQLLVQATRAVGDMFGTQAECVEASALLTATVQELGFDARPRAVSLASYVHGTGRMVATGERARTFLTDLSRGAGLPMTTNDLAPGSPALDGSEFQRAGHMIVTLADPALVLDPTFRQFSFVGLPAVSLVSAVPDDSPAPGYWHLDFGQQGFSATYFLEDGNTGWQEVFARILPEWRPVAVELAARLRDGRTAEAAGTATDSGSATESATGSDLPSTELPVR